LPPDNRFDAALSCAFEGALIEKKESKVSVIRIAKCKNEKKRNGRI
jgi:hypothetical protein